MTTTQHPPRVLMGSILGSPVVWRLPIPVCDQEALRVTLMHFFATSRVYMTIGLGHGLFTQRQQVDWMLTPTGIANRNTLFWPLKDLPVDSISFWDARVDGQKLAMAHVQSYLVKPGDYLQFEPGVIRL